MVLGFRHGRAACGRVLHLRHSRPVAAYPSAGDKPSARGKPDRVAPAFARACNARFQPVYADQQGC
jgi:hypothetical protein